MIAALWLPGDAIDRIVGAFVAGSAASCLLLSILARACMSRRHASEDEETDSFNASESLGSAAFRERG